MKRLATWIPLLLLAAAGSLSAQGRNLGLLEISDFDVPSLNLPPDFRSALAANLVARLRESGKFADVISAPEAGSAGRHPAVRLTGSVIEFKKGSQAKRYLLGPGFGKTILKARVRFVEADTGKLLLERDVDGKVIIGLLGGDSKGATNGLAKEVAKVAKKGL